MSYRPRAGRPFPLWSLLLLPSLASTACSDGDASGPEADDPGQVTAFMSDGTGQQAASVMAFRQSNAFQGEFSGTVQAEIFSETQGWIQVGPPASVQVQLQSSGDTNVGADASVPADTYSRIRYRITGGSARLDAGATIGGLVLAVAVDVSLGEADGEVTIERDVAPFTVSAESSVEIHLDLNSEMWVDEASVQSEAATDAEVQAAGAVSVLAGG